MQQSFFNLAVSLLLLIADRLAIDLLPDSEQMFVCSFSKSSRKSIRRDCKRLFVLGGDKSICYFGFSCHTETLLKETKHND